MAPETSDRRAIITDALRKIDDLSKKLAIAEQAETEPIAVVGMGCRLPGDVSDPEDYWDLLTEGRSGVVRVPDNRWDADEFFAEDHTIPGTIVNREGGFLTHWDPDEFDAEFFGLTPREAIGMDPQQRLLMEVAWEAIEDAGWTPKSLRGTQTGVFVGMTTNDYTLSFAGKLAPEELDPYIPFGNAANFAAGRLSYFLGVNGPAVVTDTACSSSLVAIHLACQSLRRRESDSALATGVNLNLSPENSIACSRWGMLAPDGTCKAFDAAANGYVRSEGCGVVALKRLSDAVRDSDPVLAVIRGTGVNQDGASSGQTVPNGPAQQALMRRVLGASRLNPADIDYVEAHGTGTPLGDPIELDALYNVFGERGEAAPLVVGSVKTNLGHLESASGVAGFIKAVLAVENAHIPRQLHFSSLNPHACEGASAFTIAAEPTDWPDTGRPRRAGVSSFGVSGTNAHIVIEQAPDPTVSTAVRPEPLVNTLVVAGKTRERVATTAGVLADWLGGAGADTPLSAVAYTLAEHRASYPTFASVTAADKDSAIAGLRAIAGGYKAPGVVGVHNGVCRPGTVFVYSGQGSQWAGMGRRLLQDEPAFAAAVDELEPDFIAQAGFSLRDTIASGCAVVGIDRIQPVLVGMQLALTALWRSKGVEPTAVIGHSMGEVAAAVVSGALTVADGLKVISTRSRLMSALSGQGAMALLGIDAAEAEDLVRSVDGVTIAVYAAPGQTVIAGPPEQVDSLVARVAASERLARRVEVDVASHHPIIDPILPDLRTALADLNPHEPTIPLLSTADPSGAVSPRMDADYWCRNLRNPVRFSQVVAEAGSRFGTFIEVSPHPLLTHALDETLRDEHHHSVGTLYRDTDDLVTFGTNLAATHTSTPPSVSEPAQFVRLPHTPWHHSRYWVRVPDAPVSSAADAGGPGRPGSDALSGGSPLRHGVLGEWLLELGWRERAIVPVPHTPAPTPTPRAQCWLVVSDDPCADEIAALLGGARVLGAEDVTAESLEGTTHVLYAPAPSGADTVGAAHRTFGTARRLATLLAGKAGSSARLHILTRNAQSVADDEPADPGQAVLWGFGRTLGLERPDIFSGATDVAALVPPELVAAHLLAETASDDGDDQVVYRAGRRLVPRLRRADVPTGIATLPAQATQLVVGATGNVGPDLIRQLAAMGAGTVVAVSRSGSSVLAELTEELAASGTTLVTHEGDAADPGAMAELFTRFGADLPPLDGVYIAALAGGAAELVDMSDDDATAMFRPKVDAVDVLHRLTLRTPVRRFVLFSSVTGLFGSRWLGHYTAANAYADAVGFARHAMGLPATVIDWGLWKSWADAQPETAAAGLTPMPNDKAISTLPMLLAPGAGVRPIVIGADWERLAQAYRMRTSFRIVDELLGIDESSGPGHITDLAELPSVRPGTVLGDADTDTDVGYVHRWQGRLEPTELPYPGSHLVQGVDVVPASVLMATVARAAHEAGAAGVGRIRFQYPVVADRTRVVRVSIDADGELMVSSATSPGAGVDEWVVHVTARTTTASAKPVLDAVTDDSAPTGFDADDAHRLQQRWGIDGQPYPWNVVSHSTSRGTLSADIEVAGPSGVAFVDAAVHLARLLDDSHDELMFPVCVDALSIDVSTDGADTSLGNARAEIRHTGGDTDGFTADAAITAQDGSVIAVLRGLRFAAAEPLGDSAHGDAGGQAVDAPDWAALSESDTREQLRGRLRAILAREIGMPADALRIDQPFPELGLDSMMAMTVLRDARHLVGMDLSATMLWNHPTIEALSDLLTDLLEPRRRAAIPESEADESDVDSVLDSLFDSVESLSDDPFADAESVSATTESGDA